MRDTLLRPPAGGAPDLTRDATDLPPLWDPEVDDTLICRAVREETPDVRTFILSAPEPRRFRYRPGQFLTYTFEIEGRTVNRCYTIASTPTRPDLVTIT